VRLEAAFTSTPLFVVLTTQADGRHGMANFTAPLNLGTFALRAFATTGEPASILLHAIA
jgi:hypothetical protein